MSVNDIRLIGQSEYDRMVSGQKKFFDDLVERGRARIVPDGVKQGDISKAQDAKKPERKPGPVKWLIGKKVLVKLMNAETLTGILSEVWQYELIVATESGEDVVVMKHAIGHLREVRG